MGPLIEGLNVNWVRKYLCLLRGVEVLEKFVSINKILAFKLF